MFIREQLNYIIYFGDDEMKILIKNCNLISMAKDREKIENNIDILIEDGIIKQINKNIECEAEKVIEATGKIIMPGLINTHAHMPMSIFRETIDGYNLQEWLEKKIWPMEDKLTPEDIYYASLLSCVEMIKTGTTTINDMYFMTDEIIKAVNDTGVRIQTTRALQSIAGGGEQRKKELEELINKYNNKFSNITFNIGIHGFYTSSNEYVEECVEIAKRYNLPIHIHFCENQKEVEDIKSAYNVDRVSNFIKKYFKGQHVILAHAVKLSKEDIEELNEENIYISHCPISNLKLGCGIANVSYMNEQGIVVSLGTDGQGSGSSLDLFEVMKYTCLLQKGILENPELLPAYEVLKMATINGAKALKLENKVGSIEQGKQADIIMINMDSAVTTPVNNIFSEIVYNVKGNNVEMTMVNGKILMENSKLKYKKEKEVYEKCEEIIKRIGN